MTALNCLYSFNCHLLQLQLQLIYDRQPVGQSVLVSGAHLGPVTNLNRLVERDAEGSFLRIMGVKGVP
jgi:hypothetical protein